MATTKLSNLINPEVMSSMISAKVEKKAAVIPFAKVDTTLQGQAGNTITIAVFGYIGDAANVEEGASIGASALTTTDKQFTVKKIGKGVDLTDEAILSGYGDPVGEANRQLAMAISQKIDQDAIDALLSREIIEDTEEYFDLDEDGEIDHTLPKFDYQDYKDEYVEKSMEDLGDFVDEYVLRFGYDGIEEYIDFDKVGEMYVDIDGPAHWLAYYDGVEIEETVDGQTYYIYRRQ